MNRKFITASTLSDLKRFFPVISELRPRLTFNEYVELYNEAHKRDEFNLVAIEEDNIVLAVMGYRILFDFVRGKHVYIDDLVSTEAARSKGLGAELLLFAKKIAIDEKCKGLRLCTGLDNFRGIKFYEKHGWTRRAYAYVNELV